LTFRCIERVERPALRLAMVCLCLVLGSASWLRGSWPLRCSLTDIRQQSIDVREFGHLVAQATPDDARIAAWCGYDNLGVLFYSRRRGFKLQVDQIGDGELRRFLRREGFAYIAYHEDNPPGKGAEKDWGMGNTVTKHEGYVLRAAYTR